MGTVTDARIAGWQKEAGIERRTRQGVGRAVAPSIRIDPGHRVGTSGIRDGDGYWHGSDALEGTIDNLIACAQRVTNDADLCPNGLEDHPGIIMKDTTALDLGDDGDGVLEGVPAVVQDTTISESTFTNFGDKTWTDLKARTQFSVGTTGGNTVVAPEASYNGDGSCNTADLNNWGHEDPQDPCGNLFRIVLTKGDVDLESGYGQGILIIDWDDATNTGGEIDFEDGMHFNGIVLGRGCVEVQRGATVQGSVFVDGTYFNDDLCDPDKALDLNAGSEILYSSCAVERAIENTGMTGFGTSGGGGFSLLTSRAFAQLPR